MKNILWQSNERILNDENRANREFLIQKIRKKVVIIIVCKRLFLKDNDNAVVDDDGIREMFISCGHLSRNHQKKLEIRNFFPLIIT